MPQRLIAAIAGRLERVEKTLETQMDAVASLVEDVERRRTVPHADVPENEAVLRTLAKALEVRKVIAEQHALLADLRATLKNLRTTPRG